MSITDLYEIYKPISALNTCRMTLCIVIIALNETVSSPNSGKVLIAVQNDPDP
jgi:hypothetical protein